MAGRHANARDNNVVYLFAEHGKLRRAPAETAVEQDATSCSGRKEQVFFIRRGSFRCMINGAVGIVRAGEFVRVAEGTVHAFDDIGHFPGLIFGHAFPQGIDARLLIEIAAAIPASALEFPRSGTPEYCELRAIAKRWGVRLDEDDAAA